MRDLENEMVQIERLMNNFESFEGKLEHFKNINALDGLKSLEDNSIDLILTDPPYEITKRGNSGTSGGMLNTELSRKGKVFKENDIHVSEYAKDFYRVLKNNSHCLVMCNHKNLQEFINEFVKVGFRFTKSLVWVKNNKIMGKYYMSQFEYILLFQKGSRTIFNCGTSDVLYFDNKKDTDPLDQVIHPSQKPLDLFEILVENSSNPGDKVLDPFCGVGTTLLACQKLNRNYFGYELDNRYYEYALAKYRTQVLKDKVDTLESMFYFIDSLTFKFNGTTIEYTKKDGEMVFKSIGQGYWGVNTNNLVKLFTSLHFNIGDKHNQELNNIYEKLKEELSITFNKIKLNTKLNNVLLEKHTKEKVNKI